MSARDATRERLTDEQVDILRHMVGRSKHRRRIYWGFRNYFAANPESGDDKMLAELHEGGYVVPGARGRLNYWHCTALGCEAAGLDEAQTQRALHGD